MSLILASAVPMPMVFFGAIVVFGFALYLIVFRPMEQEAMERYAQERREFFANGGTKQEWNRRHDVSSSGDGGSFGGFDGGGGDGGGGGGCD